MAAFRQNLVRIKNRDYAAVHLADTFEKPSLAPGQVSRRGLPLLAVNLNDLVHAVYQEPNKLAAVLDNKYPAVTTWDDSGEP